ncbi:MAG TPA: hypothetical protein VFS40_01410 [Gemmatimonadales bacterium]|nr:hypothetical protein [Gemmatimonadales bacterium]
MAAPPIPSRRLWFGILAAPLAWVLIEAVGYFLVARNCAWGGSGLRAWAVPHAPAILVALTVLGLAAGGAAFAVARASWQGVTGPAAAATPAAPDPRTTDPATFARSAALGRARFLAYGGMFTSGLFLLGILLFGLPALLVQACAKAH